ncbi:MAG TPA: DUF1080 domain-containing protein [Pirellulales bacterium]|nr:DUF1080 domain-containing protein [Pirellulales bacterium]
MSRSGFCLFCALSLAPTLAACAAEGGLPTFTDAASAGPDFVTQGEYVGQVTAADGEQRKLGIQVIALGDGKFRAVAYPGGLPGEGWQKGDNKHSIEGKTDGSVTVFKGEKHEGRIEQGVLKVLDASGKEHGKLNKVERKSPTLGAKPPAGAVVLFDGTSADNFEGGKMTPEGWLQVGTRSKQSFGSCTLHIEFRTPFMPTAQGQARGNSGVYLQDCYEFQVLDSFGLEGKNNECGGLYAMIEPKVNMCLPPLSWQTYDFEFTAPKFDGDKKVANARATLRHNGVVIYDDLEIPRLTPGGRSKEAPTGPLMLQNHGNPVVYRNIWVVERK